MATDMNLHPDLHCGLELAAGPGLLPGLLEPLTDNRILPPQYRVLTPGHQQLSTLRQIAAEHQAGQPGRVPGT
jgi:hypothetical protein